MDPDVLVSEEDRGNSIILTKREANLINEKTLSDVIELLFENMKEESENIDMISRKSLVELAERNLSLVIKIGIETLKTLTSLTNANQATLEYLTNYTNLLKEIIEKNGNNLDRTTYKIASSFVIDAIQLFITSPINNPKEIEKTKFLEKKIIIINKLLLHLANFYFTEILSDIMQLFNPGSVPHRVVIEMLTELAMTSPVKASQNYQEVVSRTLPILASIQDENMRVIFSNFFSQVSESAIITIENQNESNRTFNFDSLSHLFATAFDLINAQWMQNCRSHQNKIYIVNSLIMMGTILPETSLRNNIENIINIFINNLKKDNIVENIVISKSFRIFFENVVIRFKERIETSVNNLLVAIFPNLVGVNISPNVKEFDANFMQVKSELLKIYFILFKNYLDKTFTFLVSRFESLALMERLSNLYLIKTMLLRGEHINNSYRDMLLSAISKATHESDLEFKYASFELIYVLFEKELLTGESSIKLISYLVKEAGYSDEEIAIKDETMNRNYPFYTNLKILRDKSENVLIDVINKIPDSEKFFWPHILDYLYDFKYNGSSFILCKMISAIKNISDNKMEEFKIDFSNFNNIPTPSQIFIKLFIILSNPLQRQGLPNVSLNCLKIILPILHNDLNKLQVETNELEQFLRRGKYFDFNIYNDVLLSIFEKILMEIKSSEFMSNLTDTINENIQKYKNDDMTVGVLMRMQGCVLSRLNKREVIKNHLDNLFNIIHPEFKNDIINGNMESSQPSKELRLGVAEAYGLCAKSHLDIVLDKINAIFKSEIQFKKATGFASFFASSKDPEVSQLILTTLVSALGSIAKYSDSNLLQSRINSNFLSHIDNFFKDEKSSKILKNACVTALGNIFKSLHKLSSFYLDKGDIFILQNRDLYLDSMLKIFKNEKNISELKISALNNIAFLIKLDPPISLEQSKNFIYLAFSVLDQKDLIENEELQERILDAMNNVFESILVHENHFTTSLERVSIVTDNFVVVDYENILNYDKDILSSWDFFSLILEKFVERFVKVKESNIKNLDKLRQLISERIEVFVNSKKSVKFNKDEFPNFVASLICLLIFLYDENNTDNEGIFICISRLFTGLDEFDLSYSGDLTQFSEDLAMIIKSKFNKEEFLYIFKKLFYLLKNKSHRINKFSSILLEKLLLENKQYFMTNEKEDNKITKQNIIMIDEIVEGIVHVLEILAKDETSIISERYLNVLNIAEEMSKVNLNPMIEACLKEEYGLPLPVSLTSILQRMCKEKILITKIFTKITDIINNGDPGFENKPNYAVCASTVILGTMLQTHDPVLTPLIKKFLPQLLSTLLLRIGSAHSINYTIEAFKSVSEDPRNQTVWAMQQLMSYSEEEELSTCLESGGSIQSKLMNTYEYDEGIYELMLIFCKKNDHLKQSMMYDFLSGFLDRPWSGQRVVVVSCYAQFVNFASVINCKVSDFDIVEWRNKLIIELTKTISDSDELARKQSIRGLANLCRVYLDCTVYIENYIRITEKLDQDEIIPEEKKEIIKKNLKKEMLEASYGTSIINLLIEKLSDNTESVVLESLNSLQQMMEFLSIKAIIPCISNLLVKLRPCFDINNHNVRSLGFNLFNRIISLVKVLNDDQSESQMEKDELRIEELIKEQIHLHLVSLILHTNDEKPGVRNNCFKTLCKALIVILGEDVHCFMDEAKLKYGDDYNRIYDDFIKIVAKLITEKYPNKIPYHISNCINHSLSPQDTIRASSVYLIGTFYDNLTQLDKVDVLKMINLENIFNNFAKLLKDFSSKVKIKTVKSLAFFKQIKTVDYK